jgi:hypothetical protein
LKWAMRIALFTSAIAAGWAVGLRCAAWRAQGSGGGGHTGLTIEKVQPLAGLVTMRVEVADVLESDLDGYTGGMRVALLVKGDFLMGVDLSEARFEKVDDSARMAVLVLPQPRARSPRLDHEKTKVFAVSQSGLWQVAPGGSRATGVVIDRGYRDAQRLIAAAYEDPALIARSRGQAQAVLAAFFKALDWDVSVKWRG